MRGDDRRQRADHRLDALVGRQQAEGQQHAMAFEAEFALEDRAVTVRAIRHAVWHHRNLVVRHTMDAA